MRIELADGRVIAMRSLEQRRLYAGVLCGRPTAADNIRRVREFAEEAGRHAAWFDGALVIPAEGQLLPAVPGKGVEEGERLPSVVSFAVFECGEPAKDPGEMFSSAAFVWCQDDFGVPDEHTIRRLKDVDWPDISVDGSF